MISAMTARIDFSYKVSKQVAVELSKHLEMATMFKENIDASMINKPKVTYAIADAMGAIVPAKTNGWIMIWAR